MTTYRSGYRAGQRPVRLGDTRPELRLCALDAVALVADARERGLGVDLDEEGPVGEQSADGAQVELEDVVDPELRGRRPGRRPT